ncbi:hypothetical protein HY385_02910 [Candidatus Daviesbacteria bacterium]|nr:hypothetical protein [Candidatus Daviesbacteria bacterium]
MNDDNFKIILEEALNPIKEQLGSLDSIKKQLEDPRTGLKRVNGKLDALWDQTVKLTEAMEETKETLKSQDNNLNRTSDDVAKVNKRLTKVEDQLGIVPPSELALVK